MKFIIEKAKYKNDVILLEKVKKEPDESVTSSLDNVPPFCGENPIFKGASNALDIR